MAPRSVRVWGFLLCVVLLVDWSAEGVILWSDLGATLVHENAAGADMLGGALKRDDTASDTLYFKFHVDPISDVSTEEYFAAFELFDHGVERLGLGNSLKAWAYSAFNTAETGEFNKVFGDLDLRSLRPESSSPGVFLPYELPRRGIESTIVVKVQYVPGKDDQVTVWLNPDLSRGATEAGQPEGLTTHFAAKATFDEIRLRHGGGGGGWTFSDMAIATSFGDFVGVGSPGPAESGRDALPLTFRAWQREQGLSQNTVRAIAQTTDGYLWVGTDDGVSRFDGVRFVNFGMREGWRSGRVRVLLAGIDGALWIGTVGGGLARWESGNFATLTSREGLPADAITALAMDNEKRVWVGTEAGLGLCVEGRSQPLPAAAEFKGRTVTALLKDAHGVMWVGVAGAGIFRFLDGRFARLTDPAVESLLLDPHCLLEDQSGRIWLGAGDDFVLCREGEQWRRYRVPRHLARPIVSALAEQPDGTVWAGSVSEGLFQFKGGKLSAVNASTGLSDNFVESLLVDREGSLWVGTGAGLNRIRRSNLAVFGQNEGLGYGPVQGLGEVTPGVIWAGKPSDGLYRFDGRNFERLSEEEWPRRYADVNSVLVSRDGHGWVATGQGLLRIRDPKIGGSEEEQQPLAGRNVIALAEDRDARLWAGTREGEIWSCQNGNWEPRTNLTQTHPITVVEPGRDGLWFGTGGGGFCEFRNGRLSRINRQSGLLSDLVRALHVDGSGTLWVGTVGGGLSRWRDGRLMTFTTREGLPDNTVSQILEDDAGRLWLGSNRGIASVRKSELEELADGKLSAVYPLVYGRAEGMLSEECTGGFSPAGLKTKSGLLWFATLKGVVVADPRPKDIAQPGPSVVLEEVFVDGISERPRPLARTSKAGSSSSPTEGRDAPGGAQSQLQVPPGQHRLEFHYTGLSFRAPDRIRFRYRLEGLDPDWVDAGTHRTAFYGYVPPGTYRFQLAACNSDGIWSQTSPALEVVVLRHFWQAWWFIGLTAVTLVAGVAGAARLAEKRKHQTQLQRLEQERALERERARIAQDLHDDLGSSLTRLSLLGDLLRTDKDSPRLVEAHARKITQSASHTVRALEEIVWALRPGSDSLQSLIDYIAHFANELFEGDEARCRLDLPPDLPARPLPPDMRHNLFLVLKESLTNALKHAHAKEVRLQAKMSGNRLEFIVQDDGRGFHLRQPSVPGKGHGLGNMRRRAESMGGTLTVTTEPGQGTIVRLVVSLPELPAGVAA